MAIAPARVPYVRHAGQLTRAWRRLRRTAWRSAGCSPRPVRQASRLAATLEEHREDALLYRRLATLRTDAPIGTLEETRFAGVPRERFLALCDALGTGELRDRPRRWAA